LFEKSEPGAETPALLSIKANLEKNPELRRKHGKAKSLMRVLGLRIPIKSQKGVVE
jgi:hypothetical protein